MYKLEPHRLFATGLARSTGGGSGSHCTATDGGHRDRTGGFLNYAYKNKFTGGGIGGRGFSQTRSGEAGHLCGRIARRAFAGVVQFSMAEKLAVPKNAQPDSGRNPKPHQ